MPKPGREKNSNVDLLLLFLRLAIARTIQAKKRRPKNAGKPRPPRDLLQKKL